MDLRGKRALVTGGGVRLGRAMAYALLRQGVDVAIHYNSSAHGAKQTAHEGEAMERRVALLQADLSDPAAAEALAGRAAAELGGLDILINSAAIMERAPLADVTPAIFDRTIAVNLRAPFFVLKGAAAAMTQGGAIVNMADLAAFERWTGYPVHAISKAGIVVLTELMARALAPKIRVNAIAPGAVLLPDDWENKEADKLRDTTPLKRLGKPDDVVKAMLYLLESDYVTGETIVVDGGRRIR